MRLGKLTGAVVLAVLGGLLVAAWMVVITTIVVSSMGHHAL